MMKQEQSYLTFLNIIIFPFLFFFSILTLNVSPQFVGVPFFWIAVLWFFAFLSNALFCSNIRIRIVLFNAASFLLIFGGFECYCWIRWKSLQYHQSDAHVEVYKSAPIDVSIVPTRSDIDAFLTSDPLLGIVPYKDNKVFGVVYSHGQLLIPNTVYTTNAHGLRISPPCDPNICQNSILFFGGSYTFGAYVNDDETLPYQVGIKLARQYHIYNFGFNGYGPHHLLAALDSSFIVDTVVEPPQYAIYQAIPDHVCRIAGLRPYSKRDPKYVFDKQKEIKFAGHFDDQPGTIPQNYLLQKLQGYLNKSFFYTLLMKSRKDREVNDGDIDLFLGIIANAEQHLERYYPDISFHIIIWDDHSKISTRIVQGLSKNNMIHLVTEIIPDYQEKRSAYMALEHPTSLAYETVAEYIVHHIVKKNSPDKSLKNPYE